ncbi:MAG: alginate lyase family protein [Vicinamibacterales bacterium]|nr:alginate lyase family protein [Vicinamibacterales bacterium]
MGALLKGTCAGWLDELWARLAARPFPFTTAPVDLGLYDDLCPGDTDRILTLAELACAHEVDLLGSGPIDLGPTIDWLKDYKTGHSWPRAFMRDIEYNNLERASDVKFPWELSRLQWLIPAGQAYVLTADERYALEVRNVIDHWIRENPYASTVNWSCTMEAALRIVSWTWFFHVFNRSEAWADVDFRCRFLTSLFLHGRFTARYLEHSDVNGNHCTADAAGLVFAGLFFGRGTEPNRWLKKGWDLLAGELPKQVTADGVDYEASIAYHRLVLELFLLPAMYRTACGQRTPTEYRERLVAMARFVEAYSRSDGTTPLWGDADDGRMLPLGGQALTDHRYLIGLVGLTCDETLRPAFRGPASEIFWLCGAEAVRRLSMEPSSDPQSIGFSDGGFFVMRNDRDHVFIDCGPVGLAGRGGHGHNDCLSFEAMLAGTLLVTDSGCYVYTASREERNRFRSTDLHNTPRINNAEINRFIAPDNLWQLQADATPEVREWKTAHDRDVFVGSHSGYMRFATGVRPVRTIELDHRRHALRISDCFEGAGEFDVEIPLHLDPRIRVTTLGRSKASLQAENLTFRIDWTGPGFATTLEPSRVSPRYGVALSSQRLVWRGRAKSGASLTVRIAVESGPCRPQAVGTT